MMTVKIYPMNGRFAFETVASLPHDKGKYIAGFAISEEDAKRRATSYAGEDTVFIGPNVANKPPTGATRKWVGRNEVERT